MLSKEMYTVLSCFPRKLDTPIIYNDLIEKCPLSETEIRACLAETLFPEWNYVNCSKGWQADSELYLTESGLAKIEAHEQSVEDRILVEKSVIIARTAMWAAIASAIITVASLAMTILELVAGK